MMAIFRGITHRGVAFVWCLLAGGLSCFNLVHAQRPTGQIRIEVKDPSGAAVASSGKLENLSAGTVQRFETDAQGNQTFTALSFGRYRLEVTSPGFARESTVVN